MPKATFDFTTILPSVDRLAEIVAASGDSLMLGSGPPHPDANLLDLVAAGVSAMKDYERAADILRARPGAYQVQGWKEARAIEREAVRNMRAAAKIRATTAAGIYGKAMLVRTSRTGAGVLCHSLAQDLLDNETLRLSLWGREGA